ncbi:hypothetical protein Pla163_31160 [Planctomycetes bacterium Pla163]|uniref:Nucleotidyl transferase AbiEii toxin, Type IV TA system n=1 Tax=Rohdeia mirabilis TaxID=2528008 RepID=A0A518D3C8_9BACT|nr:hypothetical protein Pla163_31160 [Planctomycetes bacterium Pla163]
MTLDQNQVRATIELARVLDALGLRYVVGGSMAASLWGEPRFTRDSDFAVDLALDRVDELVAALQGDWYVDRESIVEAVRRRRGFNIFTRTGFSKVDVYVPPDEGIHPNKWGRAQRRTVAGTQISITSSEDIVLQKLDWFRQGGEQMNQQLIDVVEVLRTRGSKIDDAYLDEWAARIGVADLLERVRASARPRDVGDA